MCRTGKCPASAHLLARVLSPDAAPIIENLPPAPFGLIVETPAAGDVHRLWHDAFQDLIRVGLVTSICKDPQSDELHDVFDWAYILLISLGDYQEPEEYASPLSTSDIGLPDALYIHKVMHAFAANRGERDPSNCVVLSHCT